MNLLRNRLEGRASWAGPAIGLACLVGCSSLGCSSGATGHEQRGPTDASSGGGPNSAPFCSGTAYRDEDGDGWGVAGSEMDCTDERVPKGYSEIVGDCNDHDPNGFWLHQRDADGDGFGDFGNEICAGYEPPEGYVREAGAGDCDDTDMSLSYSYYRDADGDGLGSIDDRVCGPPDEVPEGATLDAGDCDPADPARTWLSYEDADGDGFAGNYGVSVCAGREAPKGFSQVVLDCDDTSADVNPYAVELWDDSLDSDCDGHAAPFECADGSCESESVPTDVQCQTSDLALVEVSATPICYRMSWAVAVANLGTVPIPEFAVTIEQGSASLVLPIREALEPGVQRVYVIPSIHPASSLSGVVTFLVSSALDDCHPENGTALAQGSPLACAR